MKKSENLSFGQGVKVLMAVAEKGLIEDDLHNIDSVIEMIKTQNDFESKQYITLRYLQGIVNIVANKDKVIQMVFQGKRSMSALDGLEKEDNTNGKKLVELAEYMAEESTKKIEEDKVKTEELMDNIITVAKLGLLETELKGIDKLLEYVYKQKEYDKKHLYFDKFMIELMGSIKKRNKWVQRYLENKLSLEEITLRKKKTNHKGLKLEDMIGHMRSQLKEYNEGTLN